MTAMPIEPSCIDAFQQESIEYAHLKPLVKEWIDKNCELAKTKQFGVYRVKHWFQKDCGYVTHGVLTIWLDEWGYRVKPHNSKNCEGTYNHDVCLKRRRFSQNT